MWLSEQKPNMFALKRLTEIHFIAPGYSYT